MNKVLYISNRTGFSGAEVVLLRLIQSNKNVTPVVLAPHGLLTERLEKIGVKVYLSESIIQLNRKQNKFWWLKIVKNLIFGFLEFAWIILKEKPNIVHANGLGASIYSSISSWVFRKPFVWTDHDVFEPGSIEANWAKRLSGFSKKIITVSRYVEESLVRVGISKSKLVTIYNGLDYSRFDPQKEKPGYLREKLDIGKTVKILAVFALITPWKGHNVVIEVAKSLRDKGRKDFIFLFVGETDDEDYKTEIDQRIKKLKLNDLVKFTGFVENTIAAYRDTDILINASIKPEPLGTTIYEGMAMEKLVIASKIGGNPEIIEDGKTGFLVPASDSSALAAKIESTLDNWDSLKIMQAAARDEVKKRFTIESMVNNYNKVYAEIKNS